MMFFWEEMMKRSYLVLLALMCFVMSSLVFAVSLEKVSLYAPVEPKCSSMYPKKVVANDRDFF